MNRHDAFMTDPAFRRAIIGARTGLDLIRAHENADPEAEARLVAMTVLVAFTNAGGLVEPHAGVLAAFAPDLGFDGTQAVDA